ncbi:TIGR03118 family protein [Streptomyces sp. NPDC001982]|uniref:TIGR03118 family protein n=1 Tax=Streptomyces sp. NPDC001982 TaxID=3154405 RepID=UPI00332EB609
MSLSVRRFRAVAALVVAASSAALAVPAVAVADPGPGHHDPAAVFSFNQINMVSDVPGMAPLTDPDAVNPWGLALSPTSPLWVSNAGTSTSTVYGSPAGATTATKSSVRVTVPGTPPASLPSGQVANTGQGFVLSNGTKSGTARFIFSTLGGDIDAWSPQVDSAQGPVEVKASVPGASYTGLALATATNGDQLYAADFAHGRIDVFDSAFKQVALKDWQFKDADLPEGYVPFNAQAIDNKVFVTYDKPDPTTGREGVGSGIGIVDEFTPDGSLVSRIATKGALNAPWGVAVAPASWGSLAGSLLVGNFGDGRINVFRSTGDGRFEHHASGQLHDTATGQPVSIPGLWALTPGTAATGGTDSLWFSAGIDNEAHGLIGVFRP